MVQSLDASAPTLSEVNLEANNANPGVRDPDPSCSGGDSVSAVLAPLQLTG